MNVTSLPAVGFDDEVLLLSERDAVRTYLDGINARALARLLWAFSAVAAVYALVMLSSAHPAAALLPAADAVAAAFALRRLRRGPAPHAIRALALGFVAAQYAALAVFHLVLGSDMTPWVFIAPFLLLYLRAAFSEYVAVAFAITATTLVTGIVAGLTGRETGMALHLGDIVVGATITLAFAVLVAVGLTRRTHRAFLRRWSADVERNRDRLRMKQELEHARDIQLSMLPHEGPECPWLDIASLSLPATEVGGDYYDYFEIDEERLAIVVGDVAGHGVASGLVLAGVRSALNLLAEDLAQPHVALERLNRTLRRTAPRSMTVSLLIALFDRRERTVTLASAGAAPPLLAGSDGAVRELTGGSPPLGALAASTYQSVVVALSHGDTVLLSTDGLAETTEETGAQLGYDRLARTFSDVAGGASAKDVRDALIRELWTFKGTVPQVDDVTLLVVRPVDLPADTAPRDQAPAAGPA